MTAHRLKNIISLLDPKSIVLTGASSDPNLIGSYVLRNIIYSNYKGKIFPINTLHSKFYEFDTYQSIRDIKKEVDLAIITSNIDQVLDEVFDCARIGVKNILILTRGFLKMGSNGQVLIKKIQKIAQENNINLIGPNSLGIISTISDLNASFAPEMPKKGRISMISQAGSVINSFLDFAKFYNAGVSELVGLGNKVDLSEIDFLNYYRSLREDGMPLAIGAYLENISNGKEFLEICPLLTKKIPFVAYIPSESFYIKDHVFNHTGSVMQENKAIDLALEYCGVTRASSQEEMFNLLLAFSWQPVLRGDRIAVISNAGGALVMAVDDLIKNDLKLVNFSPEVKSSLKTELFGFYSHKGAIDIGGQARATDFGKALDIILGDSEVDSVLVILSHQIMTQIEETAETIGRLAKVHKKPIFASFLGYDTVEKGIKALSKYYVPAFKTISEGVKVLSKMYDYYIYKEKGGKILSASDIINISDESFKIRTLLESAKLKKKLYLSKNETIEVLKLSGVEQNFKQISSFEELTKFANDNRYPIEMYCSACNKTLKINNKKESKNIYENHLKEVPIEEDHKLSDHYVYNSFNFDKRLSIKIYKDNYYEYFSRGFSIAELEKYSFGHMIEFSIKNFSDKKSFSLLPLSKEKIIKLLNQINFFEKFGNKEKVSISDFKNYVAGEIQKISAIPQNFNQILNIEIEFAIESGKLFITSSNIDLDFMV